jgi:hypothetical protein
LGVDPFVSKVNDLKRGGGCMSCVDGEGEESMGGGGEFVAAARNDGAEGGEVLLIAHEFVGDALRG